MTKPLPKFVIVVDGKPFIKGFDKGEIPNMRADFTFKKAKMTPYKQENKMACLTKDQIDEFAKKCKDAYENHPAFPNLTPEQVEEIIKGIGHEYVC